MRKGLLIVSGIAVMLLTACGGGKDNMKEFALDFGAKAAANQVDSVKMLYPSFDADSIAMRFNADSITITNGENPGTFTISYGKGVTVDVKQTDEGACTVVSSRGLYAFKPADVALAKSFGMLDTKLDDKAMKARIAEIPAVKEHVSKAYEASNMKNLSYTYNITGSSAGYASIRRMHIKLTNNGNVPIKGSDYKVICRGTWQDGEGAYSKNFTLNGKDVPVGKTVTMSGDIIGSAVVKKIEWRNRGAKLDFDKDYKPTGKEYSEYLAAKKDTVATRTKSK